MKTKEITRDLLLQKIDQADRIHSTIVSRMHKTSDHTFGNFNKNMTRLFKIDSMIESLHSFRREKQWTLYR